MGEDRYQASYLGLDLSTSATSVAARDEKGNEGFAAIPIRGATTWRGEPAFEPAALPEMVGEALARLASDGWDFSKPGHLCASVRQHDMVLADRDGRLLIPFVTWQSKAASREVEALRASGAEAAVGRVEERFILPKLLWALKQDPSLAPNIFRVMTTGDYLAWILTGLESLSTSDALSNGLLLQETKQLATQIMTAAGLDPGWFPPPIQSGRPVGVVRATTTDGAWNALSQTLQGWTVHAGLGDNHAGGVGSGLTDRQTIVISLGSSGTVIRKCLPGAKLAGNAASFEYFEDKLLLMMLHDCAVWYDRFLTQFNSDRLAHSDLNRLAVEERQPDLRFICQKEENGTRREVYPSDWAQLSLANKVASTQASITVHMLRLVRDMLAEVTADASHIGRFVITGGLSRSAFVQQALVIGLDKLRPRCGVFVSGREGPLANKAAAVGALFTAMVGTEGYPDLSAVIEKLGALESLTLSPEASGNRESFEKFVHVHL